MGTNPSCLAFGETDRAAARASGGLERVNQEWLEIPAADFHPQGAFTADAWMR
ncbi:MAG: hypothetical protein R3F35_08170 [Myxococcota bacterium]